MARTDNFRKQHADILTTAREINALLTIEMNDTDASTARRLLSKMHGQVSLHLAMEDKSLYPTMMASADPRLPELARRYQDEMGALSQTFENYVRKWPTNVSIMSRPSEFITESKAVFNALSKRIHHENTVLYKLVDEQ